MRFEYLKAEAVLLIITVVNVCVDLRAEKRKKSAEEVDPMDPAAYSDAPKYEESSLLQFIWFK